MIEKSRSFQKKSRFQRDGQDADIIERKSGGGCLAVFGIAFSLAGLLFLLTGFGLSPIPVIGGLPSHVAALIFGLIFTVVGGILILGRSGLIIDRRRNQVVQWQGLIVPLKRTVRPLGEVDSVRLECIREDKTITYPVQLKGAGLAEVITVERTTDYLRARQTSEELARFLRKPIEDLSSGKKMIRDPDHLDESLRDRVRRLRDDPGFFPSPPLPMRTKIEQNADGVIISLPGPALGLMRLFPLAVALLFALFAAFVFLPGLIELPSPPTIPYLFIGFIVLFAIMMPVLTTLLSLFRSIAQSTRITATRAFLRLEERAGGKTVILEIPADELEEMEFPDRRSLFKEIALPGIRKLKDFGDTGTPRLPDGRPVPKILLALMRMVPSQGITARSDRTTLTFGKGLPDAELAYLYALLLKILTD